jgi:hypothetical protein
MPFLAYWPSVSTVTPQRAPASAPLPQTVAPKVKETIKHFKKNPARSESFHFIAKERTIRSAWKLCAILFLTTRLLAQTSTEQYSYVNRNTWSGVGGEPPA